MQFCFDGWILHGYIYIFPVWVNICHYTCSTRANNEEGVFVCVSSTAQILDQMACNNTTTTMIFCLQMIQCAAHCWCRGASWSVMVAVFPSGSSYSSSILLMARKSGGSLFMNHYFKFVSDNIWKW